MGGCAPSGRWRAPCNPSSTMTKPSAPPAFFQWKPSFEVGIPQVDAEHRQFFEIINELYAAMTKGEAPAVMAAVHARLVDYAASHFRAEEEFLAAVDYPALAVQVRQHAWFLRTISELRLDSSDRPRETLALARDWMLRHILGTDKHYAAWLDEPRQEAGSGVKRAS